MTSTEFANSKYQPLAMPMPFGANSDSNYVAPSTTQISNAPNFLDGFPAAFSSPHSGGGRYVTRQQMNGIGNLASRYEFYKRMGGITTFDPTFASAVGGYPAGTVLDFLDGTNLHKVYSLVDNNTVNFLESGVDGINWALLNQDEGSTRSYILSVDNIPSSTDAQVGTFRAARSGPLSIESSITSTDTSQITSEYVGTASSSAIYDQDMYGYGIMIVPLGSGSSPSEMPNAWTSTREQTFNNDSFTTQWSMLLGGYSGLLAKSVSGTWNVKYIPMPSSNAYVTEGTWYGVKLFNTAKRHISTAIHSTTSAVATFMQFTLAGGFKLFYTA